MNQGSIQIDDHGAAFDAIYSQGAYTHAKILKCACWRYRSSFEPLTSPRTGHMQISAAKVRGVHICVTCMSRSTPAVWTILSQ